MKSGSTETLSLEEARHTDWLRAVDAQDEVYVTAVRFVPLGIGVDAQPGRLWPLFPKHSDPTPFRLYIHGPDGVRLGEFREYVPKLLSTPLGSTITERLIDMYDDEKGYFKGGYLRAKVSFAPDDDWYLIDKHGLRYELGAFIFDFECRVARFSIKTQKFSYNDAQVATVTKEMQDLSVTITVTERKDKEPTMGLVIEQKGAHGQVYKQEIVTPPLPESGTGAIHFSSYMIGWLSSGT